MFEAQKSNKDLSRKIRELVKNSQNGDLDQKLDDLLKNLDEERNEFEYRLDESNRELNRVRGVLNEFERIKNEFISVCAHDLRSPTNSILSFLEILRTEGRRMSDADKNEIIERMDRAGHHMLELISDLLDTVQIESGKFNIEPVPVLLSQLAKDALVNLKGSFESKEITTSVEAEQGELRVKLDLQKGMQIIINLLGNALKFTPRGGRVDVLVRKQDQLMVCEVRDTGTGIPEEELGKVFEKFSKISVRATEGEKSTGLGLTIVKQLLDIHKGSIDVKSKVGEGTSFIFKLPVAESSTLMKLFSGKKR